MQDTAEYLSELGYSTEILPVDYETAPKRLRRIIGNKKPRVLISLGTINGYSVSEFYLQVEAAADNMRLFVHKYPHSTIRYDDRIRKNITHRIELPPSNLEYLKQRFDASNLKYDISHDGGSGQCNSLLFEGILATINSKTKFYFFHVPMDINANSAKRDNLVRAIEALTH